MSIRFFYAADLAVGTPLSGYDSDEGKSRVKVVVTGAREGGVEDEKFIFLDSTWSLYYLSFAL